jgi:hypothetical protein
MKPIVGLHVRRTTAHPAFPIGMLGTIDVVHENGEDFWVVTDAGGFNGWTSFASWQPIETHADEQLLETRPE